MPPIRAGFQHVLSTAPPVILHYGLRAIWKLIPLALAYTAYLLAPRFGVLPMTASELALAIDGSSTEMKATLITALITIAGFLIAFRTAHSTWRAQRKAELRIKAADELTDFAQDIFDATLSLDIDVKRLLVLVDAVSGANAAAPHPADVQLALQASQSASARAAHIQAKAVTVFALDTRNQLVAAQEPTAAMQLPIITRQITEVGHLAVLLLPGPGIDVAGLIAWARTAQRNRLLEFANAPKAAQAAMVAAGAARGALLSAVLRPTIASFWRILRS